LAQVVEVWTCTHSAVGIATGYGMDDIWLGIRVPVGSGIFTALYRPDRLWTHAAFLPTGMGGLFPKGKADGV
jgi:hypothetical protein